MEAREAAAFILDRDIRSEPIGFGSSHDEIVDQQVENDGSILVLQIDRPAEDFLVADFVADTGD